MGRIPFEEYKDAFKALKRELFPENGETIVLTDVLGYIDYKEWIDGKL